MTIEEVIKDHSKRYHLVIERKYAMKKMVVVLFSFLMVCLIGMKSLKCVKST